MMRHANSVPVLDLDPVIRKEVSSVKESFKSGQLFGQRTTFTRMYSQAPMSLPVGSASFSRIADTSVDDLFSDLVASHKLTRGSSKWALHSSHVSSSLIASKRYPA
jgi:hypothetical protein